MGLGRSTHSGSHRHQFEYEHKLAEFVDRVKESLEAIQEAVKILAMGIDYRRYSRFSPLTPYVTRVQSGDYVISRPLDDQEVTEGDVQFCIDFVVETAVKLCEFDYSLSATGP